MADAIEALESLPEIIVAAGRSGLGVIALAILVVAIVAIICFRRTHPGIRLSVFVLLFLGAAAFVAAMLQQSTSVLAGTPSDPITTPVQTAEPIQQTPAAPVVDAACIERLLAETRAAQEFSQEGGVGCPSAGISGRGVHRSRVVTYRAPPDYSIVGDVRVEDVSRIDGSYGAVEYVREDGHVAEARVSVECRSESQMFGPGASMRIRLRGMIEKPVTDAVLADAEQRCRA